MPTITATAFAALTPRAPTPRDPVFTSTDPNITDFETFVSDVMQVPPASMPSAWAMQWCFDNALNITLDDLQTIASQPTTPTIFCQAVYNLGGAFLCDFAQDDPPQTYWTDLRKNLGINSFSPGVIQSASDQGTSSSLMIPDFMKGLTLMDMQLLKTPWGRAYLMIAQAWGSVWGITY
jgi:hypothetical protein